MFNPVANVAMYETLEEANRLQWRGSDQSHKSWH